MTTEPQREPWEDDTIGNRELDIEGSFCGAHHIGGMTWRFGSGDYCHDPEYGAGTLDDSRTARFIVAVIDNAIREAAGHR